MVKQRSALLKSAKGKRNLDPAALTFWDAKLAALGARITRARLDALEQLLPYAQGAYRAVAPGEGEISLSYSSASALFAAHAAPTATDIEQTLLERIDTVRAQEVERGVCLVGPHRDDMDITLGTLPAKGYASHGESWSCALALRLGSFELLSDDGVDGEPVLILDDVFAELDSGRRAALAQRLAGAGQVLITAAVAEDVPSELREHPGGHTVLRVTPGQVSNEDAGGAGDRRAVGDLGAAGEVHD